MHKIELKPNWLFVACIVSVANAVFVPLVWWGVETVRKFVHGGVPAPQTYSWVLLTMGVLVFSVAYAAVFWRLYYSYNTIVTDEYMSQPRLTGRRIVRWAEVKEVDIIHKSATIQGTSGKAYIDFGAYQQPDEVDNQVRDLLSKKPWIRVAVAYARLDKATSRFHERLHSLAYAALLLSSIGVFLVFLKSEINKSSPTEAEPIITPNRLQSVRSLPPFRGG